MPQQQTDIRDKFGLQYYLKLLIKGEEYNPLNVFSLVVREWVFEQLPRLELIFLDDGTLSEVFPLEDNDQIDVTIATNKDDDEDQQLNMSFNVVDWKINPHNDNSFYVKISAVMKNNDIFSARNRSFNNSNSLNVLIDIALEEGIDVLNPWNVTPGDNMTWYQYSINNYDFIKHVLERSFVVDDVPFFYANSQNEFVFTSLRSETEKSDETIARFNLEKTFNYALEEDDKDTIWFSQYDIVNFNGYNNKQSSYGVIYTYYDLEDIVTDRLFYDNIYGELSFRDATKVASDTQNPSIAPVYGHLNNVYDEYFRSLVRNEMLIKQFFSFSLMLNANGLSKVKLFDKIDLIAPASFGAGGTSLKDNDVNEVMSGNYLVGGITHKINANGTYNKLISLHRDGMNRSPFMTSWRNES